MQKVRQFLIILTVISLSNAHLVLMQGVTWIEMAANASSNVAAFFPALAESIKPETKCERCCQLDKSQQEQHKRSVQWESKLIGTIACQESFIIPKPQATPNQIDPFQSPPFVSNAPETPPPRFV